MDLILLLVPPTPYLDSLLREMGDYISWWCKESVWRYCITVFILLVLGTAFAKSLFAPDSNSVRQIAREEVEKKERERANAELTHYDKRP